MDSRSLNSHHNNHDGNSNRYRNQNKTHSKRQQSVNTKLQPITSKLPTKSMTNPLKLTLIETNGNSFVANNYPDAFNTHFYRWPIASRSPSTTDYNIKWKTANNPFASHFNPGIESVPISTAIPMPTTTTATATTTTSTMPTDKLYQTFIEHRLHTKHQHTGLGYVQSKKQKIHTTPHFFNTVSKIAPKTFKYQHYNLNLKRQMIHLHSCGVIFLKFICRIKT